MLGATTRDLPSNRLRELGTALVADTATRTLPLIRAETRNCRGEPGRD